jgi:hypothetical protein
MQIRTEELKVKKSKECLVEGIKKMERSQFLWDSWMARLGADARGFTFL